MLTSKILCLSLIFCLDEMYSFLQPKLLLVDRDVVALLQSREASVVTGRAIMGVVNA